jgi:hypothetical protein
LVTKLNFIIYTGITFNHPPEVGVDVVEQQIVVVVGREVMDR